MEPVFGDRRLKDCHTQVLVTSSTLDAYDARAISNLPTGAVNYDLDLSVVDVVMASCAAPTFFPPVKPAGQNRTYVDGGIWANTPSSVAVIHAHHFSGVPLTDMRLVHIGNGEVAKGTTALQLNGLRPISPKIILSMFDMMFATQSIWAHLMVERLIGASNIMRIDIHYQHEIELDDAGKALQVLPGLAEAAARNNVRRLIQFLK